MPWVTQAVLSPRSSRFGRSSRRTARSGQARHLRGDLVDTRRVPAAALGQLGDLAGLPTTGQRARTSLHAVARVAATLVRRSRRAAAQRCRRRGRPPRSAPPRTSSSCTRTGSVRPASRSGRPCAWCPHRSSLAGTVSAGVVPKAALDHDMLRVDMDRAQVVDDCRPCRDVDLGHILCLRGGCSRRRNKHGADDHGHSKAKSSQTHVVPPPQGSRRPPRLGPRLTLRRNRWFF